MNLPENSKYLIIPSGSEYQGCRIEINYTITYVYTPYALLSLPAFALTIAALVLIYSSYGTVMDAHRRGLRDMSEEGYTPPTLYGDGSKDEEKDDIESGSGKVR